RRSVHPGIDPRPGRENHGRVSTDHARLPGTGHRGAAPRARGVHQVAERTGCTAPGEAGDDGSGVGRGHAGEEIAMATVLMPPRHYLNDGYGVASWLLTRDHKRIALLYLAAVTFFFFIGGAFAVVIRLELATPPGDLVSDETYNKLFTMHGVM